LYYSSNVHYSDDKINRQLDGRGSKCRGEEKRMQNLDGLTGKHKGMASL
jgi:hypothetical protein